MTDEQTASTDAPAFSITARLCSGDSYAYANGRGYIVFRVERKDAPQSGSTPHQAPRSWIGLRREVEFLDQLTADGSGLHLDAGPVRISGDLQDWQRFLEQLVRPPSTAILESPGWRAREIEVSLPVAAIQVTTAM